MGGTPARKRPPDAITFLQTANQILQAGKGLKQAIIKKSVIYQDILLKGWREGWQKRQEVWIKHLPLRSLIEDDASVLERIRRLSLDQLEASSGVFRSI
jgi:hypothetical protein